MNIAERIEKALNAVNIPNYAGVPEFSADDEPERYVIYTISGHGASYAEGFHHETEYIVSLNVFTPRLDFELYELITDAMYNEGFSFEGGGNVSFDKHYPYITQYYLDFGIVIGR